MLPKTFLRSNAHISGILLSTVYGLIQKASARISEIRIRSDCHDFFLYGSDLFLLKESFLG